MSGHHTLIMDLEHVELVTGEFCPQYKLLIQSLGIGQYFPPGSEDGVVIRSIALLANWEKHTLESGRISDTYSISINNVIPERFGDYIMYEYFEAAYTNNEINSKYNHKTYT